MNFSLNSVVGFFGADFSNQRIIKYRNSSIILYTPWQPSSSQSNFLWCFHSIGKHTCVRGAWMRDEKRFSTKRFPTFKLFRRYRWSGPTRLSSSKHRKSNSDSPDMLSDGSMNSTLDVRNKFVHFSHRINYSSTKCKRNSTSTTTISVCDGLLAARKGNIHPSHRTCQPCYVFKAFDNRAEQKATPMIAMRL